MQEKYVLIPIWNGIFSHLPPVSEERGSTQKKCSHRPYQYFFDFLCFHGYWGTFLSNRPTSREIVYISYLDSDLPG